MTIDARGIGCPKPVIMAEEALSKIKEGAVEILVDNEASVENLKRFAEKNAFYPKISNEDNYYRVKIVKGYHCEAPAEDRSDVKGQESGVKDILLIVATDTMGKEEELGKVLMKAFFETMKVTKEIPYSMFFLNAGVKLTTTNKEIVPILKELEEMGVEIFSCGTCLKHYNLESELKAGYRGTTNHVVEGMKDFKRTIWIG